MSISPERVLEEGGESVWSVSLSCWVSFFFSSRRRHTRFDCDWSSDVCSSDLVPRDSLRVDPAYAPDCAIFHDRIRIGAQSGGGSPSWISLDRIFSRHHDGSP